MTIAHQSHRFYARHVLMKAWEDLMPYWKTILLAGAALGLTACGGGGGGDLNSTPTPTPPPTSAPTTPFPISGTPVTIFPNVSASTEFAVLGSEAVVSSSALTTAGFSVRYDAPTDSYILDFPSTQPGAFHSDPGNDDYWNGTVGNLTVGHHEVTVRKPTNPDLPLTYTTLATYGTFEAGSVPFGWLAFGTATPAGNVPVTGTASYNAEVRGSTIDLAHYIAGTATLQFNFGAGTLSGHFDPNFWDEGVELGRYDFVNTVYGSGSTTFSGQLSKSGFAQNGTFDGQFTGPAAQELMARWSAPYLDPITLKQSTMFGVWVGKN